MVRMLGFFAHPLRGLNTFSDPSKATSARPRKLGLRPQTVRVALRDASFGQDGCPRKCIGPLRGRAGFGYGKDLRSPMRTFPAVDRVRGLNILDCLSPLLPLSGEFLKYTDDDRECRIRRFAGCILCVTFLRASKKGDEMRWKMTEAPGLRFA